MNDFPAGLPRPATPPLPAPVGAFDEVRRRARRRRNARLTGLAAAAVLPVAVVAAVALPSGGGGGDGGDRVTPDTAVSHECGGSYPESPAVSPAASAKGASAPAPGGQVAPPPTAPPGAPPMTGVVRSAEGSYVRCVGIYVADRSQTLRLVARSDRYGRFSAPCRYGVAAAFTFEPYRNYHPVAGEHGWVEFANPANAPSPCAEPVAVRMKPPASVTIRLTGGASPTFEPARLELRCLDFDEFSPEPLAYLLAGEDGLYRVGSLAPCLYSVTGEGVDHVGKLGEGEQATWEVPVT